MRSFISLVIAGTGKKASAMAEEFARHGYEVVLYDIAQENLENSERIINSMIQKRIDEGTVSMAHAQQIRRNIITSYKEEYLRDSEIIIECVEERDRRVEIWDKIIKCSDADCILAGEELEEPIINIITRNGALKRTVEFKIDIESNQIMIGENEYTSKDIVDDFTKLMSSIGKVLN